MELIIIALVLTIAYAVVSGAARGLSRLTGFRHRAYRQLAAKFRGKYESRGLIDPPTVSFWHNASSVRVGMAPVIQGQAAPPRTRVVARFDRGLPFRMELLPSHRAASVQPPKGTRPVTTGRADFDRLFAVRANDVALACSFLEMADVRKSLEDLRVLALPYGMLVSINPERMMVQVDRSFGNQPPQLDRAVRSALVLHDRLLENVAARVHEGVDILGAGPPSVAEAGPPECTICGDPIEGEHVVCLKCQTPFHKDCWEFNGGCSVFGCAGKRAAAGRI